MLLLCLLMRYKFITILALENAIHTNCSPNVTKIRDTELNSNSDNIVFCGILRELLHF